MILDLYGGFRPKRTAPYAITFVPFGDVANRFMRFPNIYTLFREQTAKYKELPVFFTRKGNEWESQTWNDFEYKVHDTACAFLAKGLTNGASVAILAGNVPEWTIVDIAAIAAGGVGDVGFEGEGVEEEG